MLMLQNVVEAVSGLVEDDPCFLVPAFKALSNMAQGDEHRVSHAQGVFRYCQF